MLVDDLHVGEPGVECNEMVVCVPRSFRVTSRVLSPQLHDPLVRVRLGIRKELCKKRKRAVLRYTAGKCRLENMKEVGTY
jgi:hypothetical protein